MAKSVDNLVMGVGSLYVADFGATEPAPTELNTAPLDTDWRDVGYTQDGVTFTFVQEYEELTVDQIVDIPGSRLTRRTATIGTNLAEPTLENLNLALNGAGTITEGATAGDPDEWELNSDQGNVPNYRAIMFDGFGPNGNRRRVIVRRALQTGDVEAAYAKDGQTVFSVEFTAHYVDGAVSPLYIVDGTDA